MQSTSALYKSLRADGAPLQSKVIINGADLGGATLYALSASHALFSGETPTVGCCVADTLRLTMETPSGDIPARASVVPMVRLTQLGKIHKWNRYTPIYTFEEQEILTVLATARDGRPLEATIDLYPALSISGDVVSVSGEAEQVTLTYASHDISALISEGYQYYDFEGQVRKAVSVIYQRMGSFNSLVLVGHLATGAEKGELYDEVESDEDEYPHAGFLDGCYYEYAGSDERIVEASEWLQRGVFYISKRYPDPDAGKIELHCVDGMRKADVLFFSGGDVGQWPRSDLTVVQQIAQRMGVTLDSRTTALMTQGFSITMPGTDVTCRDVLGRIAAMYGGNFHMSMTGALLLVPLFAAYGTQDVQRGYGSMEQGKAFQKFSRVTINITESVYVTAGDDTGATLEFSCPWGTQAVCNYVLSQVKNKIWQPYSARTAYCDPAAELGDSVTVGDVTGQVSTMKTNLYSLLCPSDLSAPGGDEVEEEYPYITQEQKIQRRLGTAEAALSVLPDQIALEVTRATEAEEDLASSIVQTAEEITAHVRDNYYGKETSVSITAGGLKVNTGGTFEVAAGAAIKMSGSNFSISESGDLSINGTLSAAKVYASNLVYTGSYGYGGYIPGGAISDANNKLNHLYAVGITATTGGISVQGGRIALDNSDQSTTTAYLGNSGITYGNLSATWSEILSGGTARTAVFG